MGEHEIFVDFELDLYQFRLFSQCLFVEVHHSFYGEFNGELGAGLRHFDGLVFLQRTCHDHAYVLFGSRDRIDFGNPECLVQKEKPSG